MFAASVANAQRSVAIRFVRHIRDAFARHLPRTGLLNGSVFNETNYHRRVDAVGAHAAFG
jgi:hypothetical protein